MKRNAKHGLNKKRDSGGICEICIIAIVNTTLLYNTKHNVYKELKNITKQLLRNNKVKILAIRHLKRYNVANKMKNVHKWSVDHIICCRK